MPVTTPVVAFTVAMVGVPLLHDPPLVASVTVIVCPTHTLAGPLIAVGTACTVTVVAQ